ncbi:MAG: hypothetical protein Q8N55_02110 [bacterium]|nr:hypothetical protein [bacterium]
MAQQHKTLSQERWNGFSFFFQMANIGSEVERAIKWKNKNSKEDSQLSLYRALELIDLTISDPKNRKRLFEIVRGREFLLDYFLGKNQYGYTDKAWQDYFYNFAYANAISEIGLPRLGLDKSF